MWREEDEWPLARAKHTRYYLHSNGKANSLAGAGELSPAAPARESPDLYDYDPRILSPRGAAACAAIATLPPGAARPTAGGSAQRRAGVYHSGISKRIRSHRPGERGTLRWLLGRRHGLRR